MMYRRWHLHVLIALVLLLMAAATYKFIKQRRPKVVQIVPEQSATQVNEFSIIDIRTIRLPNGPVDIRTISPNTVFLTELATGRRVPARVACNGVTIRLVPLQPLQLHTAYRIDVTSGAKDRAGFPFLPYDAVFTTGSVPSAPLAKLRFLQRRLPHTEGRHSSLCFGPDGYLYAISIEGLIKRFRVGSDGSLSAPELIYSLQDAYGPRQERLAVGLAFDPAARPDSLVAWVTHSSYAFSDAPDWDGKLTRLSGPRLQQVTDVVVNLPRSAKDHLTNSICFGPDGALYLAQGSTTAMGEGDEVWQYRKEHLLSAAVLRLEPARLATLPLDAKTVDAGGSYNPFLPGAPLTVWATGLRNAYDLLWHSNGQLYVPTNGSASGGNVPPATAGAPRWDGLLYAGPAAPRLTQVHTQKDFLFRVQRGGYYGHPNPSRGELVMNGGNPGGKEDSAEVTEYPAGTRPDPNWRGYSYDFQYHKSPNGIIEYRSGVFGGVLRGRIVVARYVTGDLIVLTPGGPNGDIVAATEGNLLGGFSGFSLPLDLVEDKRNGNIYVSEYGNACISLLQPCAPGTTPPTPPAIADR